MDADSPNRDDPPAEAYSRVTDPGRFGVLHVHAAELLEHLVGRYDVVAGAVFEPVPGLSGRLEEVRPPVTLTPSSPWAAPIGIAFTAFPGLLVRYGRWHTTAFPTCGCDACAESAVGEINRLDELIRVVVGGGFEEELRIPLFGDARLFSRYRQAGPKGPIRESWFRVPRAVASALVRRGSRRVLWQPWPPRA